MSPESFGSPKKERNMDKQSGEPTLADALASFEKSVEEKKAERAALEDSIRNLPVDPAEEDVSPAEKPGEEDPSMIALKKQKAIVDQGAENVEKVFGKSKKPWWIDAD